MSALVFPIGVDITKIIIRMSQTEEPMIIIDIGSGVSKAGLANKVDREPRVVVPTVVGKFQGGVLVGDDALMKCRSSDLVYPIEHGLITKWEEMELILKHIFESMKIDPRNRSVMLTQVPGNPDSVIDKLSQIMFEKFNIQALFIAKPAVLSLYACGLLVGTVVEIGEGVTDIVPVNNGYAINENIIKLDFAGKELTELTMSSLRDNGAKDVDMRSAKDIKEKLCYVSLNYDLENATSATSVMYNLGNGKSASVGKEKFFIPETFFKPELTGKIPISLQQNIVNCIMKCDENIREKLFKSIILTGGSAQFPGFADRLKQEISALASGYEVSIIVPPQPSNSAWIGGAVLGTLDDLKKYLVSKLEYDSKGHNVVVQQYKMKEA